MSDSPKSKRFISPRVLFLVKTALIAGVVAVAYFFRQTIWDALAHLENVRPIILCSFPMFWLWNFLAARGWRGLIIATSPTHTSLSTWRLAIVRIEGQGVNFVLPSAALGGEVLKTALTTSKEAGVSYSATAVLLDNVANTTAGLLFAASWLGVALSQRALSGMSYVWGVGASLIIAIALSSGPFVLGGWARRRNWRPGSRIADGLRAIAQPDGRVRWAYLRSLCFHFGDRLLSASELYVASAALGIPLSLSDALFAGAMMAAFTIMLFFVPGQFGAAEGGIATAFKTLGLTPAQGLAVALLRRARQIITSTLGLLLVVFYELPRHPGLSLKAKALSREE